MQTKKIEIAIQNKQTQDNQLPSAFINTLPDLSLFQEWYVKMKVSQRVRKSANAEWSRHLRAAFTDDLYVTKQ